MASSPSSKSKLCFVDTETTGTSQSSSALYEVAVIVREPGKRDKEHHWWIDLPPAKMASADPYALALGRYWSRRRRYKVRNVGPKARRLVAEQIATVTAESHLVAVVPSFDSSFLDKFLRENGAAPSWHHHLICVLNLVGGSLKIQPPWRSYSLSQDLGIEPPVSGEAHTAMADARWARDLYDAVFR